MYTYILTCMTLFVIYLLMPDVCRKYIVFRGTAYYMQVTSTVWHRPLHRSIGAENTGSSHRTVLASPIILVAKERKHLYLKMSGATDDVRN